ncbi:MAG: hypothetical protein WD054_03385 [Gemmatimonadota bacterium]
MESELRARAESRLEQAAAELGLADPRPPYRERLRKLRESDPERFEAAIRHYEQVVLPAIAAGDALQAWLDYGAFLTGLTRAELVVVDASGRATKCVPPIAPRALALFVPAETTVAPLVALAPLEPSAAQQATLDLLVHRQLS